MTTKATAIDTARPIAAARKDELIYWSTTVAHISSGDSLYYEIGHSAFFISLVISYRHHLKRTRGERAR